MATRHAGDDIVPPPKLTRVLALSIHCDTRFPRDAGDFRQTELKNAIFEHRDSLRRIHLDGQIYHAEKFT